jgi:hypothetical protein
MDGITGSETPPPLAPQCALAVVVADQLHRSTSTQFRQF